VLLPPSTTLQRAFNPSPSWLPVRRVTSRPFASVRPPALSSFFPYTTLFRSVDGELQGPAGEEVPRPHGEALGRDDALAAPVDARSEDHTSELQSRANPVCRPLLSAIKTVVSTWTTLKSSNRPASYWLPAPPS